MLHTGTTYCHSSNSLSRSTIFSNQESIRNSGPQNSALAFPGAPKPIESNKAWRIGGDRGGSGTPRAKVSKVTFMEVNSHSTSKEKYASLWKHIGIIVNNKFQTANMLAYACMFCNTCGPEMEHVWNSEHGMLMA